MNNLQRKHHQRGVGLIEVLVALVVIAIGVIAVLGLQGTLMSGSATTKARNEAVSLAREKTEELRNILLRSQFDSALSLDGMVLDPNNNPEDIYYLDPDGNIDGVNAEFTRSWGIADVDSVKDTREIAMRVTWTEPDGTDTQVELNTLIAYTSPLISPLSLTDQSVSVTGEPDTGYEGLHPDTPMDEEGDLDPRDEVEDADIIASDESFGITHVLRYSNGHVQVWTLYNEDECAVADKVTEEGIDYCVVFTAFGGTLLRFDGTMYLDLKNNALTGIVASVRATSPSYCAVKRPRETCENASELDCLDYMCYASGDCTNGGGDCPTGDALDDMELPDLNGGWRGKVGHFFYDVNAPYHAPPDFKLCMGKTEGVDNQTIARSYYSERTTADGPDAGDEPDKWREGINQPYSCHNTLFVDFNESGDVCDDGYGRMLSGGIVWNSFKDDKVIRELDEDDLNDVLDSDKGYCDLVAIYGSIEFPDHPPVEDNELVIGKPSGTFESLETLSTGAYADFVDGECVFQEDNKGIIYACNYVNTKWTSGWSWSGEITARGTMSYDVTNLDDGTIRSYDDRVCTVTNYYSLSPERYSEDLPNEGSVISCE